MARSSFPVEVLTPRKVFEDEVQMVSTRTTTGSIGVLANHAPLMAILEPTELRLYKSDSDVVRFAQGEGYLQVVDNSALVLVEEAIAPDEIDRSAFEARLKEAREAAERADEGSEERPARSARSSATRRSWRSAALSAAAAAYFVAVAVLTATADTSDLQSSADQVADGELWRLFSSGLVVDGVAAPQIALTALAAFAVIRLQGPAVWWAAVLVGHVGSALLAYAIVGIAIALGSGGAEAAANDPDFGISCVLGASLGSAVRERLAGGRRGGLRALAVLARLVRSGASALFVLGALVVGCWPAAGTTRLRGTCRRRRCG